MTFRQPLIALAFAVLAGCATVVNPVTGTRERTVMDVQSELQAGREADRQVRAEYGVYANPTLQAYVNQVGQRLARHSHRAELTWQFTVVDSPDINAFALPGGYVYITRGLMAYLNSEAELAGVLGHEIGHVTARHASQRATEEARYGLGAAILGAVIAGSRIGGTALGDLLNQGAQIGAQGVILGHGREQELQADQLGAEYMNRVNFDPDIMITVIGVLKAQEQYGQDRARAAGRDRPEPPNWLRTHPANDQRLGEIRRIADQYQGKYADAGRMRYLQMIDGMTFGDSREHGVVRGRRFYHEPLGFTMQVPERWTFQNGANQLTALSDDLQAAVAVRLSPGTRGDHGAAIAATLAPEGGRSVATEINGLRATHFSGNKQGRPIEATVITLANSDYVLQRLQKTESRGRHDATLRDIVSSFRALNAADAAQAKPYAIRTIPLPRGTAPFTDLARELQRRAPFIDNAEGQLRLLNQVYPAGAIASQQLVKTIQ